MKNVLLKNQKTGLCSGCGICTVACSNHYLTMKENEVGELRPIAVTLQKCIDCQKCLKVCPFADNAGEKEKAILEEKCYIGWSGKYRADASSGGCCTWFFNQLLETGVVSSVISVYPTSNSDELFAYTVCHNEEELLNCLGSAYYPVTLENVLKKIEQEKGKIAIIGVPCFVTAIRNLQSGSKKWREKITVVAGLVCGHMPSKRMVDVLAWFRKKKREEIQSCRFRFRDDERPAWNYGIHLTFKEGSDWKSYGSEEFGYLFWRRLFAQKCCNYCSDVFADQADITFMDAWLPEYKEETEGTSMMIVRSKELIPVVEKLKTEGYIGEISFNKVEEAQKKLCDFKAMAGTHADEERKRIRVQEIIRKYHTDEKVMEALRRLVYKEKLRKENKILWSMMEIKDKVTGK